MPAKSKSPEAAQAKLWKAEIRALKSSINKLQKDFNHAERAAFREVQLARAVWEKAKKKYTATRKRLGKTTPKACEEMESRIAVLRGRLGL